LQNIQGKYKRKGYLARRGLASLCHPGSVHPGSVPLGSVAS